MEKRAENLVQNIGAIAETTSVFYNSIVKQVPKDVALVLTQHFMDLTINNGRRPVTVPASAVAAAAAEIQRRAMEQKKKQEETRKEEPEEPEQQPGEQA